LGVLSVIVAVVGEVITLLTGDYAKQGISD